MAGSPWRLPALVALLPQYLAVIGTLNNDALTFPSRSPVAEVAAYQMVRLLQRRRHVGRGGSGSGHLVGLALLTKTLAWVTLPLAALTVLLVLFRTPPKHRK